MTSVTPGRISGGTGIAARFQFAKVSAGTKLKASDFYVDIFTLPT